MTENLIAAETTEEIKNIIIARLGTLNPNSKILLMGESEPISVRDMVNAVREDSEFGRKIVQVQFSYIRMLTSGALDV